MYKSNLYRGFRAGINNSNCEISNIRSLRGCGKNAFKYKISAGARVREYELRRVRKLTKFVPHLRGKNIVDGVVDMHYRNQGPTHHMMVKSEWRSIAKSLMLMSYKDNRSVKVIDEAIVAMEKEEERNRHRAFKEVVSILFPGF